MADQLTEEQIAEFKEAFELFDGVQQKTDIITGGLYGKVLPVATPISPEIVPISGTRPENDQEEEENDENKNDEPVETKAIPLQDVSIRVLSLDGMCKLELAYSFINNEKNSHGDGHDLEATLFLPKQPKAAVSGLTLIISEANGSQRTVIGVVEEKATAEVRYENAISRRKGAGLLQSHSIDTLRLDVGRIYPQSVVTAVVTLCLELLPEGKNGRRLELPMLVDPHRYPLASTESEVNQGLKVVSNRAANAPLRMVVSVTETVPIVKLYSPTHPLLANMMDQESNLSPTQTLMDVDTKTSIILPNQSTSSSTSSSSSSSTYSIVACLPQEAVLGDGSVVLIVELEKETKPMAWRVCDHFGSAAIIKIPPLPAPTLTSASTNSASSSTIPTEFLFVLDRSGSMGGQFIEKAKEALQLFLRSLPTENCRFNIIGFGNQFTSLFHMSSKTKTEELTKKNKINKNKRSVKYNEKNFNIASLHAQEVRANMGGTALYEPLDWCLVPSPTSIKRRIFVITDGSVSNIQKVISLTKDRCNTNVFVDKNNNDNNNDNQLLTQQQQQKIMNLNSNWNSNCQPQNQNEEDEEEDDDDDDDDDELFDDPKLNADVVLCISLKLKLIDGLPFLVGDGDNDDDDDDDDCMMPLPWSLGGVACVPCSAKNIVFDRSLLFSSKPSSSIVSFCLSIHNSAKVFIFVESFVSISFCISSACCLFGICKPITSIRVLSKSIDSK